MLKYSDKVSRHYRLCIVTEAEKSEDGVVHTVTVGLHNRRAKGNKSLPLDLKKMGVQRLSLILPMAEQSEGEQKLVKKLIENISED